MGGGVFKGSMVVVGGGGERGEERGERGEERSACALPSYLPSG